MGKNEEKSQADQDEHGALDNKTMECEAMAIRKNGFEDSKRVKDAKNEEPRDEGNHDEDKKKEAMLTIPDNRCGEVDMVRERGSTAGGAAPEGRGSPCVPRWDTGSPRPSMISTVGLRQTAPHMAMSMG